VALAVRISEWLQIGCPGADQNLAKIAEKPRRVQGEEQAEEQALALGFRL
jgi:hypothetical protein